MTLLTNPEFWVAIGLVIFFVLLIALKVPGLAFGKLDAKSAQIKASLDEANALRAEAQTMLEGLKARRAEAELEAAAMLRDAEAEAKRLEADAHAKLDDQLARRSALAERRIALAESQATAEVKRAAAELASAAAGGVLAKRLAESGADPMADRAIAGLTGKLQ